MSREVGKGEREKTNLTRLLLRVKLAERIVQRVIIRDEENVVSPSIPPGIVLRELRVPRCHLLEESSRIDERKESDSLPLHFLSVHVDVEIGRVEVDDRRHLVRHEVVEDLGDVDLTAQVERKERGGQLEEERRRRREREEERRRTNLAAGKTPISCSKGLNGAPRVNEMSMVVTSAKSAAKGA